MGFRSWRSLVGALNLGYLVKEVAVIGSRRGAVVLLFALAVILHAKNGGTQALVDGPAQTSVDGTVPAPAASPVPQPVPTSSEGDAGRAPLSAPTHEVFNTAGDPKEPWLNLREAITPGSPVVARMPDGTRLRVISTKGKSWEVEIAQGADAGKKGFASPKFIRKFGTALDVDGGSTKSLDAIMEELSKSTDTKAALKLIHPKFGFHYFQEQWNPAGDQEGQPGDIKASKHLCGVQANGKCLHDALETLRSMYDPSEPGCECAANWCVVGLGDFQTEYHFVRDQGRWFLWVIADVDSNMDEEGTAQVRRKVDAFLRESRRAICK